MWLLSFAALAEPPWNELNESGWENQGTAKTAETGPITVTSKVIGGTPCLRGETTVAVKPETMLAVAADAPAAKRFSSETLLEAQQLAASGNTIDYYMHLDVPGWTMASDRYWVLRGENVSTESKKQFRWSRFDWRTAYPDLATKIDQNYPDAVEPNPNWGSWVLEPTTDGTKATYTLCSNPGGSLPAWVQKKAATKSLPSTIADVVREAKRREAKSP